MGDTCHMCRMPTAESPWDMDMDAVWMEEHVDWDHTPEAGDGDQDHEWAADEPAGEEEAETGPPAWQESHSIAFCSPFCQHRFHENRL